LRARCHFYLAPTFDSAVDHWQNALNRAANALLLIAMPRRPTLEMPPSAVEGAIGRVVKTPDGGVRSEAWRNGSWVPGLSVWDVLDKGRPLSEGEISKLGIPKA
jgi:hypothetical protein